VKKLNILVIGGTGFIGRTLSQALLDAGYTVTVISRRLPPDSALRPEITFIQADVTLPGRWQALVPDSDVVVNLAGASIFRRWTARGKREIITSRIAATGNIVDTLRTHQGNVRQFFNVSGIGYYGYHGDEILDESSPAGTDFLAEVATRWEKEANRVKEFGIRPMILRLGHVLGLHGGVLPKLTTLAKLHLASHWGSGNQWISWIHEDDLARCVIFLLENDKISGPLNITSPNSVRNREMMQLLAKLTRRRVIIPPVPEFMLWLMTGEFASVFVNGQRVIPQKLMREGFVFKYPDLQGALGALLRFHEIT
jgi:uncharacterized protein (TIGR01777 family)